MMIANSHTDQTQGQIRKKISLVLWSLTSSVSRHALNCPNDPSFLASALIGN